MTRGELVVLAALAASALPAGVGAETLSRAQAVAEALANNPEVKKSQQALVGLRGRKEEARADALPELTLYGSGLRYRDPSLLNSSSFDAFPPDLRSALIPIPANLYEGSASLRQTLWSFKLGSAMRAAHFGIHMGEEQERAVALAVALDTVRAYNDFLLDLERVKVAEKAVRQREGHLGVARHRRAAGVATELEVLRLEVALESQKVELERLRGEAEWARGALNAAMVHPIDAPVEPSDSLARQDFEVALSTVIEEAVASRAEIKAADLAVHAWDELVGVARGQNRPHLDLAANWGYSVRQPDNFFTPNFTKWNAAITLTVPLFDGLRNAGQVAQARAQRDQAAQDRIALENRIRLEAKQASDRLATAVRVLAVTDLNVAQAQKALDMTQANYTLGAATPLDVLDAQAAFTLAESQRLEALHAHANARATLRWVMGRDPLDSAPAAPGAGANPKAGSE